MNKKVERIKKIIKEEKTRDFFAFVFYILSIYTLMDFPLVFENIIYIINVLILLFVFSIYYEEWVYELIKKYIDNLIENIIKEIKKIGKEIMIFIPVELISLYVNYFMMIGESGNQIIINERFYRAPIFTSIFMIIINPILEEVFFRFLPYRFMKNRILYIVFSSLIFVFVHVINDEKVFYYIFLYIINSFYYGYRFSKTKDILVPIFLHGINNLILIILFVNLEFWLF